MINMKIDSGANFCQDVRMNAAIQEIEDITEGYHI